MVDGSATSDGTSGPRQERDLTDLERGVVFALGNGSETTQLVLEMLSDREDRQWEPIDEGALTEVLTGLERDGLLVRRTDRCEPTPGCGIPEWDEGRGEVVWWELTTVGRSRCELEVKRRGWP